MGVLPPTNALAPPPPAATARPAPPRILLIDSYDSFTHNLAALCRLAIPDCFVHIIQNDKLSYDTLLTHLAYFDAIVVGPGPGSPANPADVGLLQPLWHIPDDHILPIFGVCLGLQSLSLAYGAELKRLHVVKHGLISEVHHANKDIFAGVGPVHAVRYHSLHVTLRADGEIEELAYADDGEENGRVVMAARHRTKPFWGVQYHPESVRTHGGGIEVLRNFWELAERWTDARSRKVQQWAPAVEAVFGPAWPSLRSHSPPASPRESTPGVTTAVIDSCALSVTSICELLGAADKAAPFVLLDSAASPGRYSIIGALTPSSLRIQHNAGEKYLRVWHDGEWIREYLGTRDIWAWVASFMRQRRFVSGMKEVPFWGGLVGYLSYELGVHTLGVPLPHRASDGSKRQGHPDVNLVYVERSIVTNTRSGKVYVQSLIPDDTWVADMCQQLRGVQEPQSIMPSIDPVVSAAAKVVLPAKDLYISRILNSQAHLAAGDSYEICQTARTLITRPPASSWSLYTSARARNPAPHAAYIRLAPSTLVCCSPERFLSYSRAPGTRCELRPIKGTLRKAPGVGRAEAEHALVGSAKEVAENLMIVDLIRHDLHGVLGMDVQVSKFCGVEEYETVWQMVSVIEGKSSGLGAEEEAELGWEVLRRSLPPGSMTGAPKKRSVEILQTLEDDERGIYSGVVGYWDVGGGGDWAVTIRSCFKLDPEDSVSSRVDSQAPGAGSAATGAFQATGPAPREEWLVGAGGAITALSDPEAEWDEMVLKLQGVLRAFGAVEFQT